MSARSSAVEPPKLRIEAEGFNAPEENLRAVFHSAAGEIWRYFPGYPIEPILIKRGYGDPIVHYERNAHGEIVMELNSTGYFWAQYSYQFAHEFCHVLCGFRRGNSRHLWFEEMLCEMASLFVMRRMAESWKSHPPYENWAGYSDSLRKYEEEIGLKRIPWSRKIEADGLAIFYKKHAAELAENPMLRDVNGAMAWELLPLLEKNPESWESIRWLNATTLPEEVSFEEHLRAWLDAAPQRHHRFIRKVADLFGFDLGTILDRSG